MQTVHFSITGPDGRVDTYLLERLRADLSNSGLVMEASPPKSPAGAKGADIPAWATITVTILSSGGVIAIADILKSYLSRDTKVKLHLEGPGGKASIEASSAKDINGDIRRTMESVLSVNRGNER